jgi:hypothetical protein
LAISLFRKSRAKRRITIRTMLLRAACKRLRPISGFPAHPASCHVDRLRESLRLRQVERSRECFLDHADLGNFSPGSLPETGSPGPLFADVRGRTILFFIRVNSRPIFLFPSALINVHLRQMFCLSPCLRDSVVRFNVGSSDHPIFRRPCSAQ